MKPLALGELPRHHEWARYLLDPAGDPPGDPDAYTSAGTYDEMYDGLLEAYRSGEYSRDAFARHVCARGRDDPGPISVQGDLFLASPRELVDLERFAVRAALSGTDVAPDTVFDLGCGWGAALVDLAVAFPDATVIGGEYSRPGVELARELYADHDMRVEPFDLREPRDLLHDVPDETLVFTRGVLTTLNDPGPVVDRLAGLAAEGRIDRGVHLEGVDTHPGTTLGLLRRHYARVRGYDGTVLAALRWHDAVEVTDVVYDAVGPNPLHPHTAVRWRVA